MPCAPYSRARSQRSPDEPTNRANAQPTRRHPGFTRLPVYRGVYHRARIRATRWLMRLLARTNSFPQRPFQTLNLVKDNVGKVAPNRLVAKKSHSRMLVFFESVRSA